VVQSDEGMKDCGSLYGSCRLMRLRWTSDTGRRTSGGDWVLLGLGRQFGEEEGGGARLGGSERQAQHSGGSAMVGVGRASIYMGVAGVAGLFGASRLRSKSIIFRDIHNFRFKSLVTKSGWFIFGAAGSQSEAKSHVLPCTHKTIYIV
jgi:hypothetical protein